MCNPQKENEVKNLIENLSQLSQVYVKAPIQEEKYNGILIELRLLYTHDRKCFPEEKINLINNLKGKIEQEVQTYIKEKFSLLNFFPTESRIEAKHYAKEMCGLPLRTVVFHKTNFFIGIVVDRNPVHRTYKLLFLSNGYEWYGLNDLLVVGTCSKIWEVLLETYCWNCHSFLGTGDKKCQRCQWYLCPDCKACKCQWSGLVRF